MFMGMWTIGVGYLQWFHVIPALFGKQSVTVLSLNKPSPLAAKEHEPTTSLRASELLISAQIRPFDKTGRTPLERVINQK